MGRRDFEIWLFENGISRVAWSCASSRILKKKTSARNFGGNRLAANERGTEWNKDKRKKETNKRQDDEASRRGPLLFRPGLSSNASRPRRDKTEETFVLFSLFRWIEWTIVFVQDDIVSERQQVCHPLLTRPYSRPSVRPSVDLTRHPEKIVQQFRHLKQEKEYFFLCLLIASMHWFPFGRVRIVEK